MATHDVPPRNCGLCRRPLYSARSIDAGRCLACRTGEEVMTEPPPAWAPKGKPSPASLLIGGPLFALVTAVLAGVWGWVAWQVIKVLEANVGL